MIKGQLTGIGSLPHQDADAALDLIFKYMPTGPHWPQLPKMSAQEGFIQQYLQPLFSLQMLYLDENKVPHFRDNEKDWTEKLTKFYQLYLDIESAQDDRQYLSLFAFPQETAHGFYKFVNKDFSSYPVKPFFVKGQVSGPVTVGLQVVASDGVPAFYRDDLRDILLKTLAFNALWQVKLLQEKKLPVLLFIDDPGLVAYGQSTTVALSRALITKALAEMVAVLKNAGALVGVHCCAGIDWSILFELDLDIVSFDAFNYFDSLLVYTSSLSDFLDRGGVLGWGIVPTSWEIERHDTTSLYRLWQQQISILSGKGISENLLKKNYLLTPSCGAGTMEVEKASSVYEITSSLHKFMAGG